MSMSYTSQIFPWKGCTYCKSSLLKSRSRYRATSYQKAKLCVLSYASQIAQLGFLLIPGPKAASVFRQALLPDNQSFQTTFSDVGGYRNSFRLNIVYKAGPQDGPNKITGSCAKTCARTCSELRTV